MPDAVEFSHTFHRCSAPRGPSPLSSCLCPLHSVLLKGRDSSPSRHGFTRDAAPTPPKNPYPKEGAHAQHTGLPPCPCWWGTRVREVFSLPPPPLSCLTQRVITKFEHRQPLPCLLLLPCLIHSPNVWSSFKTHFKSRLPRHSPLPDHPPNPIPKPSAADQT